MSEMTVEMNRLEIEDAIRRWLAEVRGIVIPPQTSPKLCVSNAADFRASIAPTNLMIEWSHLDPKHALNSIQRDEAAKLLPVDNAAAQAAP